MTKIEFLTHFVSVAHQRERLKSYKWIDFYKAPPLQFIRCHYTTYLGMPCLMATHLDESGPFEPLPKGRIILAVRRMFVTNIVGLPPKYPQVQSLFYTFGPSTTGFLDHPIVAMED